MQKFYIIQKVVNGLFYGHQNTLVQNPLLAVLYKKKKEALKEIASNLEEGVYTVVKVYSKDN